LLRSRLQVRFNFVFFRSAAFFFMQAAVADRLQICNQKIRCLPNSRENRVVEL